MPATTLRVDLLEYTHNAEPLIHAAMRQCYSDGFAADIFKDMAECYKAIKEFSCGSADMKQQEDCRKLIQKVMDSGHDSPIEHVSFTFAIAGVSRALSHQLVRHRIASYSQQSQRYVSATGFEYIIPPHIAAIPEAALVFRRVMETCADGYSELQGILSNNGHEKTANEDARMVLPNAAETRIVVTMNCRSLLHFFELRCCARAQLEIRDMANAMLALAREALPVIFAGAGARCERLGYCPEAKQFTCGRYPRLELKGE